MGVCLFLSLWFPVSMSLQQCLRHKKMTPNSELRIKFKNVFLVVKCHLGWTDQGILRPPVFWKTVKIFSEVFLIHSLLKKYMILWFGRWSEIRLINKSIARKSCLLAYVFSRRKTSFGYLHEPSVNQQAPMGHAHSCYIRFILRSHT